MSEPHSRILIVEDEATIRRFVRLALESAGHEIHEAEGVRRGLIEAGTRRPDLIVLDLGLPDGDGIDLIRDLRQWSSMPVIVLSARSREADKIAALDAGADGVLVMPGLNNFSRGKVGGNGLLGIVHAQNAPVAPTGRNFQVGKEG